MVVCGWILCMVMLVLVRLIEVSRVDVLCDQFSRVMCFIFIFGCEVIQCRVVCMLKWWFMVLILCWVMVFWQVEWWLCGVKLFGNSMLQLVLLSMCVIVRWCGVNFFLLFLIMLYKLLQLCRVIMVGVGFLVVSDLCVLIQMLQSVVVLLFLLFMLVSEMWCVFSGGGGVELGVVCVQELIMVSDVVMQNVVSGFF